MVIAALAVAHVAGVANGKVRWGKCPMRVEARFFGCVHEPLAGGVGTHFVNESLEGDPTIDRPSPTRSRNEHTGSGHQLLGVEYVFKADWDNSHDSPPRLSGDVFHTVDAPNRSESRVLRTALLDGRDAPFWPARRLEPDGLVPEHRPGATHIDRGV